MAHSHEIQEGGCACGAVRFTVTGAPLRVGLCHCLTCRKAHGSAFNGFAIFTPGQVEVRGELTEWYSSSDLFGTSSNGTIRPEAAPPSP